MPVTGKRIDKRMVKRALILMLLFCLAACVTIGALIKLQIVHYEDYRQRVLDQMTYETEVNPERGIIYDRNGNILATNVTVYLIFISPQDIIDAMEAAEEAAAKGSASKDVRPVYYEWTASDGTTYRNLRLNELISRALSDILDVDYNDVMEKAAKKGRRYEVILRDVMEEEAVQLRELIDRFSLTQQIYLRSYAKRYYPYDTLACHVIGFTNSDGKGIYGLEAYYNNILEGTSGRYIKAQDAHNADMPFAYESYVAAEDGQNIVTTLDVYIQYELENQLKTTYYESGAGNRVAGIVLDLETNGVLAMATYPPFDLNDPYKLDEASQAILDTIDPASDTYKDTYYELLYTMWKNKAVTELYEPGSTFKIITTAMGLEEDLVSIQEKFSCSGKYFVTGYGDVHCHKTTGHGVLPYYQMLQQSCNPTMMQLAQRIGCDTFYDYFMAFGYGSRTGVDLPGESPSIVSTRKAFDGVSLAVYSFGQTFKVTPIQQITAVASVANGGYLCTPHLLAAITDASGNIVQSYESEAIRQIVSTEVCTTITEVLEDGVSGNGGAKNAYVKGYKIAAKTGTSEKRDKYDENGERSYRVGSCVAYGPADDPKVAAIVLVDEPMNGAVYGSVVAAPYVSKLLSFVLPYIGVEASYTEEELENIEISVSNYVNSSVENAIADLGWRGINYTIVGDGDTITAQVPAGGSTIFKDTGKLILYTGTETPKNTVVIPDLVGKTAEAANRLLVKADLNVAITGATNGDTATVISQFPAAGEVVPVATVVTIDVRHLGLTDGG